VIGGNVKMRKQRIDISLNPTHASYELLSYNFVKLIIVGQHGKS